MPETKKQIIDGIKISIKHISPADAEERKQRIQEILRKTAARQNVETKN